MRKQTLLYASPFPPKKSGISEYSSVLVKELSKDFDITLYTDNYRCKDKTLHGFPVLKNCIDQINFNEYDYCVYNIGNQPEYHGFIYEAVRRHPGYVILHDVSIYYLFVGYHQKKKDLLPAIYQNEGAVCLKEILNYKKSKNILDLLYCNELAAKYPMNKELLSTESRFIVHSQYAKEQILASGLVKENNILKIGMIEQIEKKCKDIRREYLFKKYGIPCDVLVIAAFGIIAETKLNRETIHAIRKLSKEFDRPLCYVMVGEGCYVDNELTDNLIIKTGYTSIQEFNSFIKYADIIVNLRNPTRGETSAALIRAMEAGKPCITNNGGWFSEIPDDCDLKVNLSDVENEIYEGIKFLLTEPDKRKVLSRKAREYAEEVCAPGKIRERIVSFMM